MNTLPTTVAPPQRVDEFTSLRGILALRVFLAHIVGWCGYWQPDLTGIPGRLWSWFFDGTPSVDTFVILSGFSISFLLHKRPAPYGKFIAGRVLRIYPVYLVCLLLAIMTAGQAVWITETSDWRENIYFDWVRQLAASGNEAPVLHTLAHISLLNGLLPAGVLTDASGTLLPPAWSLSLEWQYYLVAPLLARMIFTKSGIPAIAVIAFLGLRYGHFWQNPLPAFLPSYLPLYLIGIGSYHFYARFGNSAEKSPLPAIASCVLLATAIFFEFHPFALTVWAVAFGCVLLRTGSTLGAPFAIVRRILLNRRLQQLGKIAFPLYLVHWPVIICLLAVLLRVFPGISQFQSLAILCVLGLPVTLIAARALHVFVERPCMAYGKKLGRREVPAIAPETAPES